MLAKDLMTRRVVTVGPGHSIWHAAQIMLDRDVSGLPVVDDDGKLIGVLTEGDLLGRIELGVDTVAATASKEEQRIKAFLKGHSWSVSDVMTTGLVTVDETTALSQVASLMHQHKIKRLPVVRGGKLVGIISRKDLLRAIAMPAVSGIAAGDEALQRCIFTRLGENSELLGTDLRVSVSNGIVQLGGTVNNEAQRRLACSIAESVRGAGGIRDSIHVGLQPDA